MRPENFLFPAVLGILAVSLNANSQPVYQTAKSGNETGYSIKITAVSPWVTINPVISPVNNATCTISGFYAAGHIHDIKVNGTYAALDKKAKSYYANVDLSEGSNTVTVTATDAAGNSYSAYATVALDTSPPVVKITSPADGALVNTPDILVGYTVDGTAKTRLVHLTEGVNAIFIEETDAAGNKGLAMTHATLDTTPPDIEILYPQEGASVNTPDIMIRYTAAGITKIKAVNLAKGTNTIVIEEKDAAGNTGSAGITIRLE